MYQHYYHFEQSQHSILYVGNSNIQLIINISRGEYDIKKLGRKKGQYPSKRYYWRVD